jgi:hypothetical protein
MFHFENLPGGDNQVTWDFPTNNSWQHALLAASQFLMFCDPIFIKKFEAPLLAIINSCTNSAQKNHSIFLKTWGYKEQHR